MTETETKLLDAAREMLEVLHSFVFDARNGASNEGLYPDRKDWQRWESIVQAGNRGEL